MTTTTPWPFGADADEHDPLTALRIPVTSWSPSWRYIAAFDRASEERPTDAEAAMLASYIEEYKEYFFNDWYKAVLLQRPLDVDAVTRVFHKWGPDDWSYRLVTWRNGPQWAPPGPHFASSYSQRAPYRLEAVMDRIHTLGEDQPARRWQKWKASHPDVFSPADETARP
ncbi:hypothetical protein [Streptomyces sp. C10-9-1]|uniref:hypothetical protein n=1 Tax=Streptomyces sp. C10-9-1 TaxID=1859285 RepID=UPI003F4A82B5